MTDAPSSADRPTRCGFAALIGVPNAGKSTLINALVGSKVSIVSRKVQTTRAPVRGIAVEGAAQVLFVDTPGIFGAGVALALQDATFVLIPVKPSILDVEAARPTVEQLQTLRKPFGLVLNQCLTSSQGRTLDAATALVRSGTLAPCMIALRTDFLDAMTAGQGVTETSTRGKAAAEIRLLWAWVKNRMESLDHG